MYCTIVACVTDHNYRAIRQWHDEVQDTDRLVLRAQLHLPLGVGPPCGWRVAADRGSSPGLPSTVAAAVTPGQLHVAAGRHTGKTWCNLCLITVKSLNLWLDDDGCVQGHLNFWISNYMQYNQNFLFQCRYSLAKARLSTLLQLVQALSMPTQHTQYFLKKTKNNDDDNAILQVSGTKCISCTDNIVPFPWIISCVLYS